MKNKILSLIVCISLFSSGCENVMTRAYGGSSRIDLAKNEKLVNVTWKGTDLWLLTAYRPDNEQPRILFFAEKSTYGMLEGQIKIVEH